MRAEAPAEIAQRVSCSRCGGAVVAVTVHFRDLGASPEPLAWALPVYICASRECLEAAGGQATAVRSLSRS